ncbi:MAG: hypothetical protein HOV86_26570 [Thermoactinospora sp.]|nr:hypothetical protein [Thermoactinospora sp.]
MSTIPRNRLLLAGVLTAGAAALGSAITLAVDHRESSPSLIAEVPSITESPAPRQLPAAQSSPQSDPLPSPTTSTGAPVKPKTPPGQARKSRTEKTPPGRHRR